MATVQMFNFKKKWIDISVDYPDLETAYSALCNIQAMHPRQAYRIERKCIGSKDAPAQRMEPAPEPITTGSTSTVQGCDAKGAIVICPSCRNQFEVTHIYK
jgi:hypothetical protein